MLNQDLDDTQPTHSDPEGSDSTRPSAADELAAAQTARRARPDLAETRATRLKKPRAPQPPPQPPTSNYRSLFLVVLAFGVAALLLIAVSGWVGYREGEVQRLAIATISASSYLDEQYGLALQDFAEGRLDLARQRLEYILEQDQEYQAAIDLWVEISAILNATATPTAPPPTPTPTGTPDPRPLADLLQQAYVLANAQEWTLALETLANIRKSDPDFQVATVDGLIYLCLRQRGVDKILNQGDLEGGMYDFTLAEHFAPLDIDVAIYQNWARLYLQGNSFWLAYPEIALQYYSQVAGAAPNLKDASGMTAWYRYWASLVHLADKLAAEKEWCAAHQQYQEALQAGSSAAVQPTADAVRAACFALTPSPTLPATATLPATFAPPTLTTVPAAETPTATLTTIPAANTPTATLTTVPAANTPTATTTSTATMTPTPTNTTVPTATTTP